MPAGSTALLGLVNPVVGTALGVAFRAEPFGLVTPVGMVLAVGGAVAGQPCTVLHRWSQGRLSRRRPGVDRVSAQQC